MVFIYDRPIRVHRQSSTDIHSDTRSCHVAEPSAPALLIEHFVEELKAQRLAAYLHRHRQTQSVSISSGAGIAEYPQIAVVDRSGTQLEHHCRRGSKLMFGLRTTGGEDRRCQAQRQVRRQGRTAFEHPNSEIAATQCADSHCVERKIRRLARPDGRRPESCQQRQSNPGPARGQLLARARSWRCEHFHARQLTGAEISRGEKVLTMHRQTHLRALAPAPGPQWTLK